jgi:fumarate reductase flavoprotein subunit
MPEGNTPHREIETEIAIVGGGGVGLAAAITATENGARVILLEKRKELGGNAAMAEGLFAAESPVQARVHIDARRSHLFRIAMQHSQWKLNARLVRAFIDKSGETIEWLESKGLSFTCHPYYPNQVPVVWHCYHGGRNKLAKVLINNCQELGVKVLKGTTVKKILTDGAGRVIGVRVSTQGKEQDVAARAVIIGTGGYAGNKEMLRKYCPFYTEDMPCYGLPHTGDGISMATEIGAATEGLGILQKGGPDFPGSRDLRVVAWEPNTVWVNNRGERFMDEAADRKRFESVNALLRQPGIVSYSLFDEGVKKAIMEVGVISGLGLMVLPLTRLPHIDQDLKIEVDRGAAKIARSWEEIARWIGAEPAVLQATIDEYNADCDHGCDRVFDKERRYLTPLRTPPYYALKCYPGFLETIGGIKINHRMEVLDKDDNPIPGLYAGGVDTGGWETDTYNVELAGATLGFSVNSGRIAAENAVKYVRANK